MSVRASWGPMWRWSPMKKVGVPRTPLFEVEPQLGGVQHEVVVGQTVLVLEEQLVHLPEASLAMGCLGGMCCQFGMGVDLEREVPHHVAQVVAEVGTQFVAHSTDPGAERALVVHELHQGQGRILPPDHVVAVRIDGRRERGRQRRVALAQVAGSEPEGQPAHEAGQRRREENAHTGLVLQFG